MTRQKKAQLGISIFFIGLLLIPFSMRYLDALRAPGILEEKAEVIERFGFYLENITEETGINFVHQRARLDSRLEHILPQISSVGASVAVSDFNKNGFPDIYFTNSDFGAPNALYMNLGDGTFIDVAAEMGIADINNEETGVSMGAIWGDINNNGFEDLLVYKWGRLALFRNDFGSGFTDISKESGLYDAGWMNANTAVWLDYNGNGYLDLFVGGYFHESVNFWNLEHTRIMPDSYEYATNGGRNYLFENQGDGTFMDVSEQVGLLQTRRWTLAAAAADLNGSGFPDLVLANDYGVDELFLNENGTGFRNASTEAGMGQIPKSGMSVAFGDILNRGQFAIYITNISEPAVLMQGNNLWTPSRRSGGELLHFRNIAVSAGVDIGEWGYGGRFVDFNNNGHLDLYVANGYVSDEPDTDYWYDYAKVVGGNRNIIMEAANWPSMNGRTFSGYQTNKLWVNDGAGRFREVAASVGAALNLDSRAVAYADLFGTGSLDLIVASQNQPVVVYRNHVKPENQWIALSLEGSISNNSAIGAIIETHWNGQVQKRAVHGGDAFSSQSMRNVHIGLGDAAKVDQIVIRWPSGQVQILEAPALNQLHHITEPEEIL
ncbi:MAG: CRTAC1 family protein [Balneolales bacterium]|nr:CRTAC1 family protein [Balneolales bacterium]